jgi:hypothetical protein
LDAIQLYSKLRMGLAIAIAPEGLAARHPRPAGICDLRGRDLSAMGQAR